MAGEIPYNLDDIISKLLGQNIAMMARIDVLQHTVIALANLQHPGSGERIEKSLEPLVLSRAQQLLLNDPDLSDALLDILKQEFGL